MKRALLLALLLLGCASPERPIIHRQASGLGPRIGTDVDTIHVGNYHCDSASMLAWIGPNGEIAAEIGLVNFYKYFPVNAPPPTWGAFAAYAGSLSDTALPLVIHNIPDSVGAAVGSATFSLARDTLWITYRLGIVGGPWPNQVLSMRQWLAFDSTYAGVTP